MAKFLSEDLIFKIEIESIVKLKCYNNDCIHNIDERNECNLKRVTLNMNGICSSFVNQCRFYEEAGED